MRSVVLVKSLRDCSSSDRSDASNRASVWSAEVTVDASCRRVKRKNTREKKLRVNLPNPSLAAAAGCVAKEQGRENPRGKKETHGRVLLVEPLSLGNVASEVFRLQLIRELTLPADELSARQRACRHKRIRKVARSVTATRYIASSKDWPPRMKAQRRADVLDIFDGGPGRVGQIVEFCTLCDSPASVCGRRRCRSCCRRCCSRGSRSERAGLRPRSEGAISSPCL